MRKAYALILALFLMLVCASPSFADVGIKKDGVPNNTATDFNFRNIGNAITSDGSTLTFNLLLAGVGNGGGTSMITTDTAVPTGYSVVRKSLSSTVGVAMTLADGSYQGQILTIRISERSGSGTAFLRPTTPSSEYTTITFDAVGDTVTLIWDSAWYILGSDAVGIQ